MKRIPALGIPLALFLLATAVHAQSRAQWRLSADLRIGSLDDPDQSLTTIRGVSTGPAGRIYISQDKTENILVYDPDGGLVRAIGRRGSGPGEFARIGAPLWRGDTLYIADGVLNRVTLFSSAGDVLGTLPVSFKAQGPFSPGSVWRMLDDGSMLVGLSVNAAALDDGTVTAMPLLRVDRSAAVLDTVLWSPVGRSQFSIQIGPRGRRLYSRLPFQDGTISATGTSGLVAIERAVATDAGEGRFRVHWIAFNGDTLLARSYRYTPKPIDEAMADSLLEARVESLGDFAQRASASRGELENALREVLDIPSFLPPITAVVLSREGEVWLRREELAGDSVQWNVLSSAGDVLAEFPLPERVQPRLIEGDMLYSVERDELDVSYLVRYRIDRTGH